MKANTHLKLIFKKNDIFYILGYGLLIFVLGYVQTSSELFLRGFCFIKSTPDDLVRQCMIYSLWCIKMLMPIFYLLIEFSEYFVCSQYYFVRVKNRMKWLSIFLLKAMVLLCLSFIIATGIYHFHLQLPFHFSLTSLKVFMRDCLYYISIFQLFIMCQFMIKKGLSYIIPTIIFLCVFFIGNTLMLSEFYSIELMIYPLFNLVLYIYNVHYINHHFEKVIQNMD